MVIASGRLYLNFAAAPGADCRSIRREASRPTTATAAADQRQWAVQSQLQPVFAHLEAGYSTVTKVLRKFDHYMEMVSMGRGRSDSSEGEGEDEGACVFVRNGGACGGKGKGLVVDFAGLPAFFSSPAPPPYTDHSPPLGLEGVSVVCFPLRPKPHELPRGSHIYLLWAGPQTPTPTPVSTPTPVPTPLSGFNEEID